MQYKNGSLDTSSEQIEISIDDPFGSLRLKLPKKYKALLNNMSAARELAGCYRSRLNFLSKEQEAIISILVLLQEEFALPSEEDFRKVTAYSLGVSEADYAKRVQHVVEVIALTTRLIVDSAKEVPGFDTLTPEDQITLLKGCCLEVLMLRLSRKYDSGTNSTLLGNNRPYTRESFIKAGMGDFADFIFLFCRTVYKLQVDNTEYALLTAIAIFSTRILLLDPMKVERLRELYVKALKDYINISRPDGAAYFERLASTIMDMRRVGRRSAEQWLSVKVYYDNDKLPPIIEELLVNQK